MDINWITILPQPLSSRSSFRGTGISLFQFPTKDNSGTNRPHKLLPDSTGRKYNLPDCYEIVPAVALKTNGIAVPRQNYVCSRKRTKSS